MLKCLLKYLEARYVLFIYCCYNLTDFIYNLVACEMLYKCMVHKKSLEIDKE
jgi:hypothetical protein